MGRLQQSPHRGARKDSNAAVVSRKRTPRVARGQFRVRENERNTMLREFQEFIAGIGMSAAWPGVFAALTHGRSSDSDRVGEEA